MSESHFSGDRLEIDCANLLKGMGISYEVEPKIFTGEYTKNFNPKYFKPDIVTEHHVIELKNARRVGTPEKLPQTVLKLHWLYETLHKTPYLVYQGEVYENYIKEDVIMKQVMNLCPHVNVISFYNFCQIYK